MELLALAGLVALLVVIGFLVGLVRVARWLIRLVADRRRARPARRGVALPAVLLLALAAVAGLAQDGDGDGDCRRAGIAARLGDLALTLPVEVFAAGGVEGPDIRGAGMAQACRLALRRGPPLDAATVTFRPGAAPWRCHPSAQGVAGLVCALGRGPSRLGSVTLARAAPGEADDDGDALRALDCGLSPGPGSQQVRCAARAGFAGTIAIRYVFEGGGDEAAARRRAQELHRDFLKLLALNLATPPAALPPARDDP